jgi:hypothetical protein
MSPKPTRHAIERYAEHQVSSRVARFASPGAAKGNVATAKTFIAHARACLQAARQNLVRAEREQEGSTGKARGMLGLVIVELEAGPQPAAGNDQTSAYVARDEEE